MSSAQERKARCAEYRARALDFVLGDLAGLERTRMEAHVDRCDECRALTERLGTAFQAARRWPPETAAQDLEHLIKRLEPYFAPGAGPDLDSDSDFLAPRVSWWSGFSSGFGRAVLAAAVATVLIVAGVSYYSKDQVAATEPIAIVQPAPAPPVVARSEPEIVRLNPRPFVKLVAGGGWDGKVAGDSAATSIVMSRGFAVIDFEGGEGRKLWVGAPNASIEVVGTRFFVDTAPSGLTTIGVISGKVSVSNSEGRASIRAGEQKTFGGAAPPSRSNAETYAQDPYLERPVVEKVVVAKVQPKIQPKIETHAVVAPTISPPQPALDPLRELAAAQRLARGSDPRAALEKYDALLAQLPEKDALAPMIRYERARLLAFVLRDSRGEQELRTLAEADRGEASLQAKLSLCEIMLASDRCAASKCLIELRAREHGALATEIDRLLPRWQPGCDHK